MKNIKDISIVENTWRFDDNVANVFDKHVRQSIPHYENLQNYLASIAEWYLKDNSLIYDLGCSTGTTAIKLSKLSIDTNFTLIGYHNRVQYSRVCILNSILEFRDTSVPYSLHKLLKGAIFFRNNA